MSQIMFANIYHGDAMNLAQAKLQKSIINENSFQVFQYVSCAVYMVSMKGNWY